MLGDGAIRVLVVDDSAVMRKLISNILGREPGIEVVATAIDGDFALSKIDQIKPDVITMDIDMPRMDGISALGRIVAMHSVPVVMLSSLTSTGAAITMQALKVGAFDFVCKPKSIADISKVSEELILKVKGAARVKKNIADEPSPCAGLGLRESRAHRAELGRSKVVAIGASSGGPHALRTLLPRIPGSFGAGIVIVQHMPETFTTMLAHWLDELCEISVREAVSGDLLTPGTALIAPGGYHLRLRRRAAGAEIILDRGVPANGHMPSVEVLFQSVAKEYGSDATAIIMTGMGNDGAFAIGEIKKTGGKTIAQNEESCAVYGMPRLAVDNGFVDKVLPLSGIAEYLVAESCENNERARWGSAESR